MTETSIDWSYGVRQQLRPTVSAKVIAGVPARADRQLQRGTEVVRASSFDP
jgi:hypothetical protein